jgi:hypothetical protein
MERRQNVEALREFQSRDDDQSLPPWPEPLEDGSCPPNLKALLLEAVNGPHPMPSDYFDRLRERLRNSGTE